MKQLLIFSAEWCVNCKPLKAVLQSTDVPVDLVRVYDVDASPDRTSEFNIRSIPCSILIQDGAEVKRKTGAMTKEQLLDFVS